MLDFLEKRSGSSKRKEKISVEKIERSLEVFPEFWFVEDHTHRYPNIMKNLTKEEVTKWMGVSVLAPDVLIDEWLYRLGMPRGMLIQMQENGIYIWGGAVVYFYNRLGRLESKKTSNYTMRIRSQNIVYFWKEEKEKISIRMEGKIESEELAMIEAIMQTIWEKEGKWDVFPIYKTIHSIMGVRCDVRVIDENERIIEQYEGDLYSTKGMHFYIADKENWKVEQGFITTICAMGKISSYIEVIKEIRVEVHQDIEERQIEEIFLREKNAKTYTMKELVTLPRKDVLRVEEGISRFKTKNKISAREYFSYSKIVPLDMQIFLEQCGIKNPTLTVDSPFRLKFETDNHKEAFVERNNLKILEDGITVTYEWRNKGLERIEICVELEEGQYREIRRECSILYERTFQRTTYSLETKGREEDIRIRHKFLELTDRGRDTLKEMKGISKDAIEVKGYGYTIRYCEEYIVTIRKKEGKKLYFYQYPDGSWSLEREDQIIKSNGSVFSKNYLEEAVYTLSQEEVRVLYETVILPVFVTY